MSRQHPGETVSDEVLLHYDAAPVDFDPTRTYDQKGWHGQKPHGLWVSVKGEDDWPWWCRDQEFCLDELNAVHRVTLHDDANILWIRTGAELTQFHLDWSHETEFEREMAERRSERGRSYPDIVQRNGLTFSRNQWPVDWAAVAVKWDGIIITPYLWSHRLDGPFWYYGVDCASGCIWNLSAIKSFELISFKGQDRFAHLDYDEEEEDARGVEANP